MNCSIILGFVSEHPRRRRRTKSPRLSHSILTHWSTYSMDFPESNLIVIILNQVTTYCVMQKIDNFWRILFKMFETRLPRLKHMYVDMQKQWCQSQRQRQWRKIRMDLSWKLSDMTYESSKGSCPLLRWGWVVMLSNFHITNNNTLV